MIRKTEVQFVLSEMLIYPWMNLKKVAENLNITYTGSNEKLYDAQMAEADRKASEAVTLSKDVPDSMINTDGHFKWFEYDTAQAADVQVGTMDIESISVTDDISGLSQENFFDYQDDIVSYINEDGTLKMAERTWMWLILMAITRKFRRYCIEMLTCKMQSDERL